MMIFNGSAKNLSVVKQYIFEFRDNKLIQNNLHFLFILVPNKSTTRQRYSCEMPEAPANAKIRCEIDDNQTTVQDDPIAITNGSRCQVVCKLGYEMVTNMRRIASFQCRNGSWISSTGKIYCVKIKD